MDLYLIRLSATYLGSSCHVTPSFFRGLVIKVNTLNDAKNELINANKNPFFSTKMTRPYVLEKVD